MLSNRQFATVDEYFEFAAEHFNELYLPFAHEWNYAVTSGWDDTEFEDLYREYVRSTQIKIGQGDDATELKARPLERIARYFLEKGGVTTEIREISEPGKWQVDGQGPINTTAIRETWGVNICQRLGFQLYMEAKNHRDPATNEDFSVHFRRMEEHDCQLGIFISTSGYRIGHGKGIADSIRENYLMGKFHLLLTFYSLREVVISHKPPLVILKETLCYAVNKSFSTDRKVQKLYTKDYCHKIAEEEYQRLFSTA
jgi:hypothetical protein